ncbi:MAG: hypothetical protein II993_02680 [Anaerotignum sp.]|nr:hypothetical protein [Anaerotignum sp.]
MKKRCIAVGILFLACILFFSIVLFRSCLDRKVLREEAYYELYHSYIKRDDQYRVYLMLNDEKNNTDGLPACFDDTFVVDTAAEMYATGFGEHPIVVYMLWPCEEIPYGWQKSELNISMNFDFATFHQNTIWLLTIPRGATTLEECVWEEYKAAYKNPEAK